MENKTGEGAGGWCPVAEGGAGGGSSQDTVSRSSLSQGAACVAEDPEDRCHQSRLPEACFHEFSQMLQELRNRKQELPSRSVLALEASQGFQGVNTDLSTKGSQQDPREAVGVLWRIPQTSSLPISLTELSCQTRGLCSLSQQKPVQSSHSGLRDPQCLSVYSPSSSCENCEASTSSNTHSTGLLRVVNERRLTWRQDPATP
ncbi:uncharacterized protein [Equus caballus]|uniref:uncharacterized protein isoform X5 n=1 Tax=Equus caballus TaxID=9796 RepID=UPI0038B27EA1